MNGFITGPQKTILQTDQAVTAILIDLKQFEGFVSAFHKIGSRERVSISREGLAAAVKLDENGRVEQARLSLGRGRRHADPRDGRRGVYARPRAR